MKEAPECYVIDNSIIVALDKAGKEGAIQIIKELGRKVWGYKLGALLLRYGPSLIDEIKANVGSVNLFVDLQFTGVEDFIMEAITAYSLYSTDISYIVVNASAGPPGIRRAVESAKLTRILVGSVLDSLSPYDVKYMYGTNFPEEKTLDFALMAKQEGAHGIYCSVRDLEFLSRHAKLRDFTKIVYGVRPEWDQDHGTHAHVMTPKEVMERGATKFVIGSTIRNAKNKIRAVERIIREVQKAKQR
ncbi:MAG: hypothetical protein DRZ76_00010 [Candidatus Nealsonbacteria bacterium]|nr:MAG: hypothetical protein DRZ76_00010 [Candidatus Nealsonbacteria bacterium]